MAKEKRGSYSHKIMNSSSMMYGPSKHERTHRTLSSFTEDEWRHRIDRLGISEKFDFRNPMVRITR